MLPGNEILADRGFNITYLLLHLPVKLNLPAFTNEQGQLSEDDVTETRQIARLCIHVERSIRRLKVFEILSYIVPVS